MAGDGVLLFKFGIGSLSAAIEDVSVLYPTI
jgi:hypothetical protein